MTSAIVPPPPSPFPKINQRTVKAGTELHRNHLSSFGATQFNPCMGQATRFAPFRDSNGQCVPTLYAATSREAAAFESVFHDIDPAAPFKTVLLSTIERRSVSIVAPKRDLVLAGLFAPDLKVWGLSRTDLIETPKSSYADTVSWAQALHGAAPDIDGLVWTSRQCDPEQCVILFEDRVPEDDLDIEECVAIASNAGLLLELRDYGQRAGITIIS